MSLREKIYQRFIVRPSTRCWVWTGYKNQWGYGRIALETNGKLYSAHRLSWLLHYGEIPEGMWVLHRCDNPSCINPEHLFLGDELTNVADMVAKNRQARGESHGHAKLTNEDVLKIRSMKGRLNFRAIARMFGLGEITVYNIIRRRSWRHI